MSQNREYSPDDESWVFKSEHFEEYIINPSANVVEAEKENNEVEAGNVNFDYFNPGPNYSVATTSDLHLLMSMHRDNNSLIRENSSHILEVNKRLLETTTSLKSYIDKETCQIREECRLGLKNLENRVRQLEDKNSLMNNLQSTGTEETLVGNENPDTPPVIAGPYAEVRATGVSVQKGKHRGIRVECSHCGKSYAKSYVRRHESDFCEMKIQIG